MSKKQKARALATETRASGAIPAGWKHWGNLHYTSECGATYYGMHHKLAFREGHQAYAYDIHEAAALVACGLKHW